LNADKATNEKTFDDGLRAGFAGDAGTWALSAAPRTAPGSGSSNAVGAIWVGHAAEFESFMRDAPIDRIDEVPIGVTHPKRAFFKPGGLVESAAWKILPPGRPAGYWESYKSEIAAYELDKLLGMNMVPVAVEKRWNHETAAAILWLSPIHSWKEMEPKPKPAKWVRQVARMKMFDNFICNRIAMPAISEWTTTGIYADRTRARSSGTRTWPSRWNTSTASCGTDQALNEVN
jgi:hypothetical protein